MSKNPIAQTSSEQEARDLLKIKKRVFSAFNPKKELPADDPRYVECNDVRGSVGLLETLAETISLSDEHTCQLLSGHRGCGKTTELLRLRRLLEQEHAYVVAYCEADEYVDLNDVVEYAEVLLSIVQQLAKEAENRKIKLAPGRLQSFLTGLGDILVAPVEPKDAKTKFGLVEIGFEIKRNPNYRQQVREYLRPRVADFMQAVNEVIEKAARKFKAANTNCAGLVVIVDNLDRLLRQPLPNTNRISHDELFVHSAGQLSDLACHVIYTLPLALIHSPNGGKLAAVYGTTPRVLPMIPVTRRSGEVNEEGVRKLIEAVRRRLIAAQGEMSFDSEATIRRLCAVSGGYVRGLMTLVRESVTHSRTLPITSAAAEQAIRDMRDGRLRAIDPEHWPLLREVAKNRKIGESEAYRQLLDNLAVLEYRDSKGPWYDVNPVIREAEEFNG